MNLSDESHLDTCAGKLCNLMARRSQLKRIPGKRGWFCDRCYRLYGPKGITEVILDLRDEGE